MKKFRKIYIEITNVCNLKCSFCSEVTKKRRFMTKDELYAVIILKVEDIKRLN